MPGISARMLGLLGLVGGLEVMPPRRDEVLADIKSGDVVDQVERLLNRDRKPSKKVRMPRPAVAYPDTGIRSEVVRDTNALPKGRGARRRAAARKKGGRANGSS